VRSYHHREHEGHEDKRKARRQFSQDDSLDASFEPVSVEVDEKANDLHDDLVFDNQVDAMAVEHLATVGNGHDRSV
jgi:hypothetical protein